MLAERIRQSAILGYLAAGTIVGPNVLGWVEAGERIDLLAELGASLLLFALGLEFSIPRLRQLGARVFAAGALQIALTLAAGLGVAMAIGLPFGTAFALGSILALSSPAVVATVTGNFVWGAVVCESDCAGPVLAQSWNDCVQVSVVPSVNLSTIFCDSWLPLAAAPAR